MTATPSAVRPRMTRKRLSTSCWSSTAEGSSRTSRRVSWDSARAMLTICWLAGDRSPTSRVVEISAWPSRASSALDQLAGTAALAEAGPRDLVAEEDVLGDVEVRHQVELLVDRRDAVLDRLRRRRERRLLAVPDEGALVGLVEAGEHLDQRRLAGAVLAEQAVHLAGPDVEVDAVERPDAGELLDDPGHLQQGAAVTGRLLRRRYGARPGRVGEDGVEGEAGASADGGREPERRELDASATGVGGQHTGLEPRPRWPAACAGRPRRSSR